MTHVTVNVPMFLKYLLTCIISVHFFGWWVLLPLFIMGIDWER